MEKHKLGAQVSLSYNPAPTTLGCQGKPQDSGHMTRQEGTLAGGIWHETILGWVEGAVWAPCDPRCQCHRPLDREHAGQGRVTGATTLLGTAPHQAQGPWLAVGCVL